MAAGGRQREDQQVKLPPVNPTDLEVRMREIAREEIQRWLETSAPASHGPDVSSTVDPAVGLEVRDWHGHVTGDRPTWHASREKYAMGAAAPAGEAKGAPEQIWLVNTSAGWEEATIQQYEIDKVATSFIRADVVERRVAEAGFRHESRHWRETLETLGCTGDEGVFNGARRVVAQRDTAVARVRELESHLSGVERLAQINEDAAAKRIADAERELAEVLSVLDDLKARSGRR